MHDWDKINKKIHSKRKKSHQSTKLNSSLKTSSYTSSCYSKNLFNIMCRLIIKLSFELTFWIRINIKSSCSHFQLNSSRIAHIFNLMQLDLTENWVNSTRLAKNSSLASRELNIEIFPVFCFCITFLIESHDEKHEDYMIESHEEKS